jgi:hypothetical protein
MSIGMPDAASAIAETVRGWDEAVAGDEVDARLVEIAGRVEIMGDAR